MDAAFVFVSTWYKVCLHSVPRRVDAFALAMVDASWDSVSMQSIETGYVYVGLVLAKFGR